MKNLSWLGIFVLMNSFIYPLSASASLSASLGATKLDGMDKFADCHNEGIGYREGLIAERLELKLANTPGMTPQQRGRWLAEIAALRKSWQTHQTFVSPDPDPRNNAYYLYGLTDDEQVAINSMNTRFIQEIQLKCEQQHGGMLRYSPTSDQSGQQRYEDHLRSQMGQVIDINSVPVTPIETPKTNEQIVQERELAKKAEIQKRKQDTAQIMNDCINSSKGMRAKVVAQLLQNKLNSGAALSDAERAALQADIQASWAAAGQGLDQTPADQRLSPQEITEINTQYSTQSIQAMQNCTMGKAKMAGGVF